MVIIILAGGLVVGSEEECNECVYVVLFPR